MVLTGECAVCLYWSHHRGTVTTTQEEEIMDIIARRSTRNNVVEFDIIPTLDNVDDYDVNAIADDVIGQYFSATGTPYYVVDVDEDAYWDAVQRHAITR